MIDPIFPTTASVVKYDITNPNSGAQFQYFAQNVDLSTSASGLPSPLLADWGGTSALLSSADYTGTNTQAFTNSKVQTFYADYYSFLDAFYNWQVLGSTAAFAGIFNTMAFYKAQTPTATFISVSPVPTNGSLALNLSTSGAPPGGTSGQGITINFNDSPGTIYGNINSGAYFKAASVVGNFLGTSSNGITINWVPFNKPQNIAILSNGLNVLPNTTACIVNLIP